MNYGLNLPLDKLRIMLTDLKSKHSDKYYVFIAPFDLPSGYTTEILAAVIEERIDDVPEFMLGGRTDLDIYFVNREYSGATMRGGTVPFQRLSIGGEPRSL